MAGIDREAVEVAKAQQTLMVFAGGGEVESSKILQLAQTLQIQPGSLDPGKLSLDRRGVLAQLARDLAAELRDSDALRALAKRIEDLPAPTEVGLGEEKLLLRHLVAEGPRTEKGLESSLGVDQIDQAAVATWADDAESRNVIARVGNGPIRRWEITDTGREVIGVPSAR